MRGWRAGLWVGEVLRVKNVFKDDDAQAPAPPTISYISVDRSHRVSQTAPLLTVTTRRVNRRPGPLPRGWGVSHDLPLCEGLSRLCFCNAACRS